MVGIVIVSENKEGVEMLKAARRLLGKVRGMTTVTLRPGQSHAMMKTTLQKTIKKVDNHHGVLLLSDFFGSTQCNVCRFFLRKGSVEMVTGLNLPMLVKIGTLNQKTPLSELAELISQYGKDHICHISTKSAMMEPHIDTTIENKLGDLIQIIGSTIRRKLKQT